MSNFATIIQATGLTLLLVIIAILVGLILYLLDIDPKSHPIVLLLNIPIFSLALFVGIKVSGFNLQMILPGRSICGSSLFWITLMTLGTIILISDITNLVFYFYPVDPEILALYNLIGNSKYGLLAAFVIAPVTEEVFFRGFLISGLLHNYSSTIAIVVSSLLFGLIHDNVWQSVPAIFMGVFIGWIFIITGNIWLCIGIHAFQNGLFSILEFAGVKFTGMIYPIESGVQFQPLWLDLTGALLFIIGFHFINANQKYRYVKEQN